MSDWRTGLRLVFGGFLLLHGANHFLGLVPEPQGTQPLAVQLMAAFEHSRLLDVVMAFQAAAGLLILAGVLVPFALAVSMPIAVCALFWALILEHDPLWSVLALAALASNAVLMFANLDAYRGVLQRRALAAGEGPLAGEHYDGVYMNPAGRLAPAPFAAGLAVLLAALAFYWFLVPSATGTFAMLAIGIAGVLLLVAGVRGMGARA
jgi:hypothetical protein